MNLISAIKAKFDVLALERIDFAQQLADVLTAYYTKLLPSPAFATMAENKILICLPVPYITTNHDPSDANSAQLLVGAYCKTGLLECFSGGDQEDLFNELKEEILTKKGFYKDALTDPHLVISCIFDQLEILINQDVEIFQALEATKWLALSGKNLIKSFRELHKSMRVTFFKETSRVNVLVTFGGGPLQNLNMSLTPYPDD